MNFEIKSILYAYMVVFKWVKEIYYKKKNRKRIN